MSKLIFLDFDGVLNCLTYFKSEKFLEETKGMSDTELMLKYIWYHIDPTRVALLNNLIKETKAEVVVSSSWRLHYSIEELNRFRELLIA